MIKFIAGIFGYYSVWLMNKDGLINNVWAKKVILIDPKSMEKLELMKTHATNTFPGKIVILHSDGSVSGEATYIVRWFLRNILPL